MDEGRKRTLGVITAISAAGSLRMQSRHQFYESLQLAEELMRRIDASWPRDRVPGKN
jgi:hypothetical protein